MIKSRGNWARICWLVLLLVSITVSLVCVADKAKAGEPDPAANPVLGSILKLPGTKVYYLGTRGGLDGWLILKTNQIQIAYAIPGGQDLLIGAFFGPSGENITSAQVQAILDAHPELKSLLLTAANQPPAGPSSIDPNNAIASATAQVAAQVQAQAEAARLAPMQAVEAAMRAQGTAMHAAAPVSVASPGERLMKDLQNASGVNIGSSSAPLLMMVMDPTCPHCQKTWHMLRDKVLGNALQIRLVPITRNVDDPEEERAAAQLMHVADPLETWDKYASGDKSQLAGTPDATLVQAVRANHALIDSWHISHTPFLVYRAKDGKIKIIEGEPDQPAALFTDLLP